MGKGALTRREQVRRSVRVTSVAAVVVVFLAGVAELILGWHRRAFVAIVLALMFLGIVVVNWIRTRG